MSKGAGSSIVQWGAVGRSAPGPRLRWPRAAGLLLLGFLVATACFVGSTIYYDARMAAVVRRSHDVSENAMPSIVQLSRMRRELAFAQLLLDEAAEGDVDAMRELPEHLGAFEEALREYQALPQFPGEEEEWTRTRGGIDEIRDVARSIGDRVSSGNLHAADLQVGRHLHPAARDVDMGLGRLVELNHLQGRLAAAEADGAWARTRALSILLDALCVAATAGLALAAYLAFRRYEASTRRRNEELEAFAARVAHDIRGPLGPALVALQSLERRPWPDEEAIRRGAQRGLRGLRLVEDLVSGLLGFARIGAGPEPGASAALRPIVTGVVQDLESDARAARVEIVVEELPACEVGCTRGALASVMLNLVSNAIKHFPEDREPRRVVVRAATRGARVRVEVADTGSGLRHDQLARVFEPYVSLDPRRRGIGLGLATVRRLVEGHGGEVGVRSRPGEGATFWFEMPLRRDRSD